MRPLPVPQGAAVTPPPRRRVRLASSDAKRNTPPKIYDVPHRGHMRMGMADILTITRDRHQANLFEDPVPLTCALVEMGYIRHPIGIQFP